MTDLELDKGAAAERLSEPARRMHREVLASFAENGRVPSRAELAAGVAGDPEPLFAELGDRDVVAFGSDGEIRAAYPFSPRPTPIAVTWAGGPTVYAMCAVDALGMSAMLGRPVVITATEPDTGEVVIVEVDRQEAVWTPETAVVFAGSAGDHCCPSVDVTCGSISFFTTARAAGAWADRHPEVSGGVLDQDSALTAGVAEFGRLLGS